ncbi:MAG: hypothetical protein JNG89_09060 [Planctomycetaceae bacterium]|nr:hypothetical protein [Planctomycetaceae bacterium]
MATAEDALTTTVRQVTFGPQHHFFGYFGHVRTIPWNASGRFMVVLRTDYQDRMPHPGEASEIVLLDAENDYAPRVIERTRAWNFQQGTMLYWNPAAPDTQFFFNDRNPDTHEVFCVLFDLSRGTNGERIAEDRFDDAPSGHRGVAQQGGWFAAINYGRLARLRPVTGYPGVRDWTVGRAERHPADDGVFKVNVQAGEKQLLVSFRQLADVLRTGHPDVDDKELFINHTLWSRNDERIFFFVRGDFEISGRRLDIPFTMNADGSDLRPLALHIGGHPEWESDRALIGVRDKRQILFDVVDDRVTGPLAEADIFPQPGGDIALSPDGEWFINGHGQGGRNYYTMLRRSDGAWTRTDGFNQGGYTRGELRIDPSPNWNRDGTQFSFVAVDEQGTRQLFVATVQER